jgi:hypothetical protein
MASASIFFSWQADIQPQAACRGLIGDALESAVKRIANDATAEVVPVVDRDTQDVPGSPDIGATILAKIDIAAIFVADVTIVGRVGRDKPTPNPNVLFELGYATKALGRERIITVMNNALGRVEELPFDLRQRRTIVYDSAPEKSERAEERRRLEGVLTKAIRDILAPLEPDDGIPMSAEARKLMHQLRAEYVKANYPNYKVWMFTPPDQEDPTFNEVKAFGLVYFGGPRGGPWRLTQEGVDWIMRKRSSRT